MGGGHTTGRPPKMQSQGGGLWEVVTPQGNYPQYKAKVVAYGGWSHHRVTTQNASQGGGLWEVVTP